MEKPQAQRRLTADVRKRNRHTRPTASEQQNQTKIKTGTRPKNVLHEKPLARSKIVFVSTLSMPGGLKIKVYRRVLRSLVGTYTLTAHYH
jgi:hypothetical protein